MSILVMKEIHPGSNPLVSIIINCHNGGKYLHDAIKSILEDKYPNKEIVFFDNCSTDNSVDIAASFDSNLIKIFSSNSFVPLGSARNLALRHVSGKYICFLDSDDLFLKDRLAKQVLLHETSSYPLSFGGAELYFQDSDKYKTSKPVYKSGQFLDSILKRFNVTFSSLMFSRDYQVSNGIKFNENLTYAEDFDFYLKFALDNEVGVIQESLVVYRVHEEALTNKTSDIVADEILEIISSIKDHKIFQMSKYQKALKFLELKTFYYKALSDLKFNNLKGAIVHLNSIKFKSIKFFAVFILLLMPIKNKSKLRILNRH